MKPKTFVAIALLSAVLVAGIILILGITSRTSLPIYLLVFLITLFAVAIFAARDLLKDKIFAASIILIILALTTSFYLTNLKTYYDVVNEFGNPDGSNEISLMQTENIYYASYADYLNQIVLIYQDNNKILETQLTELKQLRLDQAMQLAVSSGTASVTPINEIQQVITVPETSYITYYPENEGGVNDG